MKSQKTGHRNGVIMAITIMTSGQSLRLAAYNFPASAKRILTVMCEIREKMTSGQSHGAALAPLSALLGLGKAWDLMGTESSIKRDRRTIGAHGDHMVT